MNTFKSHFRILSLILGFIAATISTKSHALEPLVGCLSTFARGKISLPYVYPHFSKIADKPLNIGRALELSGMSESAMIEAIEAEGISILIRDADPENPHSTELKKPKTDAERDLLKKVFDTADGQNYGPAYTFEPQEFLLLVDKLEPRPHIGKYLIIAKQSQFLRSQIMIEYLRIHARMNQPKYYSRAIKIIEEQLGLRISETNAGIIVLSKLRRMHKDVRNKYASERDPTIEDFDHEEDELIQADDRSHLLALNTTLTFELVGEVLSRQAALEEIRIAEAIIQHKELAIVPSYHTVAVQMLTYAINRLLTAQNRISKNLHDLNENQLNHYRVGHYDEYDLVVERMNQLGNHLAILKNDLKKIEVYLRSHPDIANQLSGLEFDFIF